MQRSLTVQLPSKIAAIVFLMASFRVRVNLRSGKFLFIVRRFYYILSLSYQLSFFFSVFFSFGRCNPSSSEEASQETVPFPAEQLSSFINFHSERTNLHRSSRSSNHSRQDGGGNHVGWGWEPQGRK